MRESWRIITKVGVIVGSIAITSLLGWWLGSAYGERSARLAHARTDAAFSKVLARDAEGIRLGRQFPSFPVWSALGDSAIGDVRDLLPGGGVLLAVSPTCPACLDVASAIQEAHDRLGRNATEVVLLLEGKSNDALITAFRQRHIDLPIYRDAEAALIRVHKVVNNPTYFALDAAGIVHHIGAGTRSAAEFAEMMETYCSPSDSVRLQGRR